MFGARLFARTRRRLVLLNVGIAGAIMLAFALVTFLLVSHVLASEVDQQLDTSAAQAQAHLGTDLLTDPNDPRDYQTDAPGVFLLVLDTNGTVLSNSLNVQLRGLPDLAALHEALSSGRPDLRTVEVGRDPRIEVRLRTEPFLHAGAVVGVIQVGLSLQSYNHELHEVLVALALVGGGGLLVALGAGLFLASRALAPVRVAFHRQHDFVADASHELRTPLMLVRADVDVLGRELRAAQASRRAGAAQPEPQLRQRASQESTALATPVPAAVAHLDDQLELVEDALGEIDRMSRLLGDLLLLARMDAGAVAPLRAPVALSPLLEEVAGQVGRYAQARGLPLAVEVAPGLTVSGNADQLRRLWLILLDNALRYNRPGGSVTLRAGRDGQRARVSVADTGIGIAAADLPHLFERFYRADKAHSRATGVGMGALPDEQMGAGAGLGLALAREVVQVHHGEIGVQSSQGEGSTFTVWLPLAGA